MHRHLAVIILSLFTNKLYARDPCAEYRNYSPLPDWYASLCGSGSPLGTGPKVGAAAASAADGLNLSPASIPTIPIPLGFEFLVSARPGQETHTSFSMIKGFPHFGLGLAAIRSGSFYGNQALPKISDYGYYGSSFAVQQPSLVGQDPVLVSGGALALDFIPGIKNLGPTLGATTRYNSQSGDMGMSLGSSLSFSSLMIGYSYTAEPRSMLNESFFYGTFSLGWKVGSFNFEYSRVKRRMASVLRQDPTLGYTYSETIDPDPSQILTSTYNYQRFLFTFAYKTYQDLADPLLEHKTQFHGAIQWQIFEKMTAGYMYNQLPGFHTLSLQLYL